ncbi:MAG: hypothetical protein EOP06_11995 [Proteobacteria bacterium]|nr:MAG: hypothetical protein EOP06_11995 [Pseudomonadota bacterium]
MSLKKEISKLRDDDRYLHGCLCQAGTLWNETYEAGQYGLAYHKPRHLGLIEDDEAYAKRALQRADEAETAMNQALTIYQG